LLSQSQSTLDGLALKVYLSASKKVTFTLPIAFKTSGMELKYTSRQNGMPCNTTCTAAEATTTSLATETTEAHPSAETSQFRILAVLSGLMDAATTSSTRVMWKLQTQFLFTDV